MASLLENAMERESVPALNPADAATAPAALAIPVPANLIDFMAMYGSEEACLEALINARWPGGFACP
ncbi:MAG: transposase, partial [Planctomycetes bacterium]|nr:transposase [Planctomycetota bacterium]